MAGIGASDVPRRGGTRVAASRDMNDVGVHSSVEGPPHVLETFGAFYPLVNLLRVYHRHSVRGLEHLRSSFDTGSPVLLVGNHCMDVVDPMMLLAVIHRELGRPFPAIAHELVFFSLPGVRTILRKAGAVPSRHASEAEAMLRRHRALLVYPGAGQEAALRSYRREPYTLKWYGRTGFVELALRTGAAVHFAAGIGIDEMYYQTDIPIPRVLFDLVDGYLAQYRGLRMQLGAAGIHLVPGIFPLPVKVTHVVSPPLALDPAIDADDRQKVELAQVRLWAECQAILDTLVAARRRDSDWLDRALRAGMRGLVEAGI